MGGLDFQGAAVDRDQLVLVAELVTLGMPAEVVVVVQDQDFHFAAGVFDKEMGGGQAADASAYYDEVVGLIEAARAGGVQSGVVAKGVRGLEGPGVGASQ